MYKDKRGAREKQEESRQLESQLVELLWPILSKLNEQMDRRLVGTFLGLVMAIVMHRHRNHGLLLSELGDTCWERNIAVRGQTDQQFDA